MTLTLILTLTLTPRFNGVDGRLLRACECAVMVMEAVRDLGFRVRVIIRVRVRVRVNPKRNHIRYHG